MQYLPNKDKKNLELVFYKMSETISLRSCLREINETKLLNVVMKLCFIKMQKKIISMWTYQTVKLIEERRTT